MKTTASRRINYMQTLIKREDEELTKRVLLAQFDDPSDGDFAQLVRDDFEMVEEILDMNMIEHTSEEQFKASVKANIRKAAIKHLNQLKESHSKVKHISYEELKIQPYLKSPLFSNMEPSLLFDLRSRTDETFKANFRNMYGNVVPCPLACRNKDEEEDDDTQKHMLECSKLRAEHLAEDAAIGDVNYDDIFSNTSKQKEALVLFTRLIEIRTKILKSTDNPPGDILDPRMGNRLCCSDTLFTSVYCTKCISIGKLIYIYITAIVYDTFLTSEESI